jgi:hypothetical protein
MKKFLFLIFMLVLILMPTSTSFAQPANVCQPVKKVFKTGVSVKEGVCQVHITRKEPQVMMNGHVLSPNMMDLQLGANFQQVDTKAEVVGEFALLGEEVNPVIDALRKGGIDISAIHNHMIGEFPKIYFLHFEGIGNIEKLTKAVKEAVDKVSYQ